MFDNVLSLHDKHPEEISNRRDITNITKIIYNKTIVKIINRKSNISTKFRNVSASPLLALGTHAGLD